ncbi:hypothetical protein D3C81_157330 [compost metagenome]
MAGKSLKKFKNMHWLVTMVLLLGATTGYIYTAVNHPERTKMDLKATPEPQLAIMHKSKNINILKNNQAAGIGVGFLLLKLKGN